MWTELRNLSAKMKAAIAALVVVALAALSGAGDTESTEGVNPEPTVTTEAPAPEPTEAPTTTEAEPEPTVTEAPATTTEAPTTTVIECSLGWRIEDGACVPDLNEWGGVSRALFLVAAEGQVIGDPNDPISADGLADVIWLSCETIEDLGYDAGTFAIAEAMVEQGWADSEIRAIGNLIGTVCPDLVTG